MVLTLLVILIAALVVLAAVAAFIPRRAARAAGIGICGAVVLLAVVALTSGGMTTLELPIGPAGTALHFALDPLAASFLLLLFLAMPCADAAPLPLAAVTLGLLAGDGFALTAGLLLLGGTARSRLMACASICLIAALALAGPLADFAAIRTTPPEGWRAVGVLFLTLAGAGTLALVDTSIAIYLLIRVLFDLCGPSQPLWWGAPLLLAGAGIAAIGTLRAALANTLHAALSAGPLQPSGMAVMALGMALAARAVDLPSVASHALDAVWLSLVCLVLCRTLSGLCADAIENGAGTRRLDRLGGLIHRMPLTGYSCLLGLFAVASLPPGLGFAAFWLLFQSLLTAARIGDLGLQVLIACVTALAGFSVALAALAAVRLFGVAFLGRPRTPRAAVAEEPPRPLRMVIFGVAAFIALLGLLPSVALLPAAGWTGATVSVPWLVLRTGAETPGYAPIAVAALLATVGVTLFRARLRPREQRREPAWSGGFAAPPAWLPFGDPATQYGPASFVEPLRRLLAGLPSTTSLLRRLARGRDAAVRVVTALVT